MGSQTSRSSWNYQGGFVCIATHLFEDGLDIITLKDLWNIRTLNFALFSCGFTLPDSINSLAHQPKIVYTPCLKRHGNAATTKQRNSGRNDSGLTLGDNN
jgi:hypothetical protein